MPTSPDTSTGATPGAGATPPQDGTAGDPTPPGSAPATDADQVGEAGRLAIQREREAARAAARRAEAAEAELTRLRESTQTDHERAITTARREAAAEVEGRYQARIRTSDVRQALLEAGMTPKLASLHAQGAQFASLRVTADNGTEGLTEAVEAFRKDYPELFGAQGSADGGVRGGAPRSEGMNDLIRRAAGLQA